MRETSDIIDVRVYAKKCYSCDDKISSPAYSLSATVPFSFGVSISAPVFGCR